MYDFYLTRDIDHTSATKRDRSGYIFSNEIIAYAPNYFMPITLATNPDSAIEYCYNKNKRNADGSVTNIEWYLPAIDEIEEVMMSKYGNNENTYSRFLDFQGKLYWSSQPAFLRGKGHYYSFAFVEDEADYYYDDTTSARATKVVYNTTTKAHDNVSSGVDGYEQLMEIYKPLWGTENEPEIISITTEPYTHYANKDGRTFSITIDKKTNKDNHLGNNLRTKQNRIRCIRRVPEQ